MLESFGGVVEFQCWTAIRFVEFHEFQWLGLGGRFDLGHHGRNYKLRGKPEQSVGGRKVISHLICWEVSSRRGG